jgi:enoyl-CoA hydratase
VPPLMMRRLYYTAATITAQEIAQYGAIHAVVPRAELDSTAMAVAREIAAKDTRVIRAAKEAINGIDVMNVHTSYRFEQGFTFELNLAGVSDEHRDAFVETGKPMSGGSA